MEFSSEFFTQLISKTVTQVVLSLYNHWLPLSLAILTAALMSVYINGEKLKQALLKKPKVSMLGSVAFGAFTPLCACGTMAVIVGMVSTTLPWGPVMAFLTSSPLMSPDGFILLAGVVNFKFAIALTIASIVIGLGSGYVTHVIERNTDFLKNQTRFSGNPQTVSCGCSDTPPVSDQACACNEAAPVVSEACGCSSPAPAPAPASSCGCSTPSPQSQQSCCSSSKSVPAKGKGIRDFIKKAKLPDVGKAIINVGLKQILLYFSIFVAVGYLINSFVPASLIVALFDPKNIFAVPLASLIGFPLYVSGESSIPLIKALIEGGAGEGAMLAFMITGLGTSAWVIAGISTFMKKRVVSLYISFLLVGGILSGYLYDMVQLFW